jgi:beta-galactosidase/beta-glucuronidase
MPARRSPGGQVLENGRVISSGDHGRTGGLAWYNAGQAVESRIPVSYDMEVSLIRSQVITDNVKSYFGMRKIATKRDDKGVVRLQLNNRDYFQFGPLDQGWWPDGLYTAPTDEALYYDIQKTKDFGFNMIRKHVKVEPARWYYHCTGLNMVWRDMPSGDRSPQWRMRNYFNGRI